MLSGELSASRRHPSTASSEGDTWSTNVFGAPASSICHFLGRFQHRGGGLWHKNLVRQRAGARWRAPDFPIAGQA